MIINCNGTHCLRGSNNNNFYKYSRYRMELRKSRTLIVFPRWGRSPTEFTADKSSFVNTITTRSTLFTFYSISCAYNEIIYLSKTRGVIFFDSPISVLCYRRFFFFFFFLIGARNVCNESVKRHGISETF